MVLDLGAAFDTIDHQILLSVLGKDFRIIGSALTWFASYLADRKQRVLVNDSSSDEFQLHCGVPQGSCMGPVSFILYASRLYHVIANLPRPQASSKNRKKGSAGVNGKEAKRGARLPSSMHQSHNATRTTLNQSHNATRTAHVQGATPGDEADSLSSRVCR